MKDSNRIVEENKSRIIGRVGLWWLGVFFIGRWSGTLVLLEGGWVVRYITKSDGQLFVGW